MTKQSKKGEFLQYSLQGKYTQITEKSDMFKMRTSSVKYLQVVSKISSDDIGMVN